MEVKLDLTFSHATDPNRPKIITPHELAILKKHLKSFIHLPVWFALPELHNAARLGALERVKQLIIEHRTGVNEYWSWDKHYTALHFACGAGHEDIVAFLLSRPDIDVNAVPVAWDRAIEWAVKGGNANIVKMLVERPDIMVSTVYGNRDEGPLCLATKSFNADILNILLTTYKQKFSNTGDLTEQLLGDMFLLACTSGCVDTAVALLNHGGFDPNHIYERYSRYITVVKLTCDEGQLNVVRMLLEHPQINCDAVDSPDAGWSAVFPAALAMPALAACNGHYQLLKYLVQQPVVRYVIFESDANHIAFCTHIAISQGYIATVAILLDVLTEQLLGKGCLQRINNIMPELMTVALQSTKKVLPQLVDKCWNKLALVTRTDVTDCYLRAFEGLFSVESNSVNAHILYHAVRLGLVTHISKIIQTIKDPERVICDIFPEKAISILHLAAKRRTISDVITTRLLDKDIQWNEQKYREHARWYESLLQYSSDLADAPPSDPSTEEQIRIMTSLQQKITDQERNDEYEAVRESIHWLMNRFSDVISKENACLEFTPVLVGSAAERTRPFLPDEFDYLLVLDKLAPLFHMIPEVMHMTYRLKMKYNVCINEGAYKLIYDEYLNVTALKDTLKKCFNNALRMLTSEAAVRGIILEPCCNEAGFQKRIHCLHISWRGRFYKDMKITVDLVPALELTNYKPFHQSPLRHFNNCSYYVFTKSFDMPLRGEVMPIAYSIIEVQIMRSLPDALRQGYMLAKAFRRSSLLSSEVVNNISDEVIDIESYLPTYMLKTSVLFMALHYGYFEAIPGEFPSLSPLRWGLRIYEKLLAFLREGYVPVFFECLMEKDTYLGSAPVSSSFVLNCRDHPMDLPQHKQARCCIRRHNLLLIATHMVNLFRFRLFHSNTKLVQEILCKI